jgi:hypothetical protein
MAIIKSEFLSSWRSVPRWVALCRLVNEARNLIFAQLWPPPNGPLWVLGGQRVLLHLREWQEIDDLGIDRDKPTGVRLVNVDGIHWKRTDTSSSRSYRHQPWMNEAEYAALDVGP